MINNFKKYCVALVALTLMLRCSPTDDSSPVPEDFFVKFYGAQSVEKGKEILAVDDGFLLFGSTTSENLTGDTSGDMDSDFYLVLTDNQGNQSNQTPLVFDADADENNMPDRKNQIPGRIKPTSDGGFIMIGTTVVGEGEESHTDIVVHKITSTGEHIWSTTYDNLSTMEDMTDEEGYDILEDADGGFVMVGTTSGVDINKIDYDPLNPAADPTDIFMLKVDASGQNRIWELTFGFNGADQGRTILENPAGGFAVLGSTNVNKDGAGGGENILFATTDANGGKGTEQFKAFGSGPASGNNDYAASMRPTSDGGFIIVGTSSVNDEDVTNDEVDGDNRIILMKVTATRTLTYFETLNIGDESNGAIIPCNGNDVIELSTGGFLIGGKRIGGVLELDNSGEDVFLVKTNSFGKIADDTGVILEGLWAKKYGGLGDDSAEGLLELPGGKLMVVGTNDFGGTNSTMMMLMKLNREGDILR
jgi:hypothetical protein